MALNFELSNFVTNWLKKADQIKLSSPSTYFDKFFTLYVVYNRLYAEATFTLSRTGQIKIRNLTSFPDRKAATNYLVKFIGSANLINSLMINPECVSSLERIKELIKWNRFSIKLNVVTGERQRDEDEDLLRRLHNRNMNTKANAILDLIYSIRCNTFHGHKGFEEVQVQILGPVIVLLRSLIDLINEHLVNNCIQTVLKKRRIP